MVGSIVDCIEKDGSIDKLEELLYFKFGGSMVMLIMQNGVVKIDEDIIEKSKK